MKNYTKVYLFIAGLIMMLVGSYIALTPTAYLASLAPQTNTGLHQPLNYSVNILSDIRGMGGMLLVLSIYIFLSSFRNTWQTTALLISTLVYASFILFRTVGFVLDGLPSMQMIIAYAIELILFACGFWLISKGRLVIA